MEYTQKLTQIIWKISSISLSGVPPNQRLSKFYVPQKDQFHIKIRSPGLNFDPFDPIQFFFQLKLEIKTVYMIVYSACNV